jgi:hypothetical protein
VLMSCVTEVTEEGRNQECCEVGYNLEAGELKVYYVNERSVMLLLEKVNNNSGTCSYAHQQFK